MKKKRAASWNEEYRSDETKIKKMVLANDCAERDVKIEDEFS